MHIAIRQNFLVRNKATKLRQCTSKPKEHRTEEKKRPGSSKNQISMQMLYFFTEPLRPRTNPFRPREYWAKKPGCDQNRHLKMGMVWKDFWICGQRSNAFLKVRRSALFHGKSRNFGEPIPENIRKSLKFGEPIPENFRKSMKLGEPIPENLKENPWNLDSQSQKIEENPWNSENQSQTFSKNQWNFESQSQKKL